MCHCGHSPYNGSHQAIQFINVHQVDGTWNTIQQVGLLAKVVSAFGETATADYVLGVDLPLREGPPTRKHMWCLFFIIP